MFTIEGANNSIDFNSVHNGDFFKWEDIIFLKLDDYCALDMDTLEIVTPEENDPPLIQAVYPNARICLE